MIKLSATQQALVKMLHDGGRIYYMSGLDAYCFIAYKTQNTRCTSTAFALETKGVLRRMPTAYNGNCEFELTKEWKKK